MRSLYADCALSPPGGIQHAPELGHHLAVRVALETVNLDCQLHFILQQLLTLISVTFHSRMAGLTGSLCHWKYMPLTER